MRRAAACVIIPPGVGRARGIPDCPYATAFVARSAAIRSAEYPSAPRISSVCSPAPGGCMRKAGALVARASV